ncbi:MAG TPA: hypothetical protein VIX60_02970 [Candidatus Cybelea sp.]
MSSRKRRQLVVAAVLAALAVAALRDLSRLGAGAPWRTMDDFPDFYCAGWALDRGANPYTYEPLHTCERRVNVGDTFRGQLFAHNPWVAFPAPLPAYDFFPFMALGRLSLDKARVIDAAAIVASIALTALALAGLGIPLDVSVAALLLSTGFVELNTGQVIPFALLALVLCGLLLERGNDRLAGIFAVVTSIEPIVGVPVIAATLCFVPRARWTVVLTGGIFALLALRAVGGPVLLEYAVRVVPAQAASEIHFPFQYSLTYALAYFGFSPGLARLAGALSYLALLVIGLLLAPRVTSVAGRRELLVFVPAFCCVIGGAYLHQEELCFALPALLALAVNLRGLPRTVFAIALCVLSVPWILVWGMKQLFAASIFVCSFILLRLRVTRWPALCALCAIVLVTYAFELHPPYLPVPAASSQAYASNDLVQNEWRDYAQGRSTGNALWLAIKFPTWAALLAALAMMVRCSFPPRLASVSSLESLRETPRRRPASRRARTGLSDDRL